MKEPTKAAVHDGVCPEKSSVVSLEKGLMVKRERKVRILEKREKKKLVAVAVAVVMEAPSPPEKEEVVVVAVEVRWSRTSM